MAKNQQRRGAKKSGAVKVTVTLGDLVAAAFDTVGAEVKQVAKVLTSKRLSQATGRRFVLV